MEKAREARTVGILMGTLGVDKYLDIVKHLEKIIKATGKKYYTFAMGKINPAKLANFMEIDVYVLVACSENSLLDSQEFFKPVVTPFEMELACKRERQWSGEFVSDFQELLLGKNGSVCDEILLHLQYKIKMYTTRTYSFLHCDWSITL